MSILKGLAYKSWNKDETEFNYTLQVFVRESMEAHAITELNAITVRKLIDTCKKELEEAIMLIYSEALKDQGNITDKEE